jgi:hypothetical protein
MFHKILTKKYYFPEQPSLVLYNEKAVYMQ